MGALSSGVTGLKVHQSWLDVTGDNLANLNTVAFKGSNVTFAELLSQTVRTATGPVGSLGGTNPQQMGSGVGMAGVTRNMSQGNIAATGQDLDAAIDGSGYFVLNNGTQDVYTRIGSFGIDAENTLVDPATGYKVQRIGTTGEAEGFQTAGDSSIRIPWDAAMPASATTSVVINGNLRSSTDSATAATRHKITGNQAYTTNSGATIATASSYMSDLDQWNTALGVGDTGTIRISGVKEDGTTFTNQDVTWTGAAAGAGDTWQDVLDQITALFDSSTATLNSSGEIEITGDSGGYSVAQITSMSYIAAGADDLSVPTYFDLTTAGGNDSKSFNITVYDPLGNQHVLNGVFVKTDTENTWDLVIPTISGELSGDWTSYDFVNSDTFNRRISGIQFASDGSYNGLASGSESLTIGVQFVAGTTQNMTMDLGTVGEFGGLTQFYSTQSSAAALSQDGYEAGTLAGVSIDIDGTVVGTFTNGVKADVAVIQLASFQNPNGLEAVGNGYYLPTANSGEAVASVAASGGVGSLTSKSLEQSNVDVATQFVNLMQAQNGFQSNARTIRVANDLLRELTNLIR
ncbi:MAG TPA: flagellar hook-basal body complex protein [Planctomycetes bacterium]|nr:flagellar hook-basal body complex protein [Planctomycetota bacterium]